MNEVLEHVASQKNTRDNVLHWISNSILYTARMHTFTSASKYGMSLQGIILFITMQSLMTRGTRQIKPILV